MVAGKDLFGANKQKVRQMDTLLIDRYFGESKGNLRYLGLPASTLTELMLWRDYFAHFSAVERGNAEAPFIYQHNLVLTALQHNLASRLRLLRGDIDDILKVGTDEFGNSLLYPYDVVSLDYSGGLIYKDESGDAKRVEAIQSLITSQAQCNHDFLLFISINTDNHDQGEIRRVIENIGSDLNNLGLDTSEVIEAYLHHPNEEARLKVYVPFVITQLSSTQYQCEHFKPIFYSGNRDTRMIHFSAWMKRTREYAAGRPSRQTFVRILNLGVFECVDGQISETDFGIKSINV